MINFCTLFDSNYLTRGLALNNSLANVCPSYHLYVIAFDDNCYHYLKQANLPNLTPISLKDFEDQQLLAVKPTRSIAEYCWTCTPSTILYCIETFKLPSCTYIDSDMIFYRDPAILFDEVQNDSVLITPHRYTSQYDQSATHGIYCVEFMFFRNDEQGMIALRWWRERCIEWCYDHLENGKFGDQKYLDDWTSRFQGVKVLQHEGGGLAPWNIQQYVLSTVDNRLQVRNLRSGKSFPIVFFHFHGLKFYTDEMVSCSGSLYELKQQVKDIIYVPYIKELLSLAELLKSRGIGFNVSGARQPSPSKNATFFQYLKELSIFILKGRISPFNLAIYNYKRHYHFYKNQAFH